MLASENEPREELTFGQQMNESAEPEQPSVAQVYAVPKKRQRKTGSRSGIGAKIVALADTLAVLTILAGLALAWGFTPVTLKLLAVVAFLWLTSPVASHLIGRLEVTVNDQLPQEMQVEDSRFVAIEKEADQEVRR